MKTGFKKALKVFYYLINLLGIYFQYGFIRDKPPPIEQPRIVKVQFIDDPKEEKETMSPLNQLKEKLAECEDLDKDIPESKLLVRQIEEGKTIEYKKIVIIGRLYKSSTNQQGYKKIESDSVGRFSKFQLLAYKYDLLIETGKFNSEDYSLTQLLIVIGPNLDMLSKAYDYVRQGGRAICFYKYDENSIYGYYKLFNVSISPVYITSTILDGALIAGFADGLHLSSFEDSGHHIVIQEYIDDIGKDSLWHSEIKNEDTGIIYNYSLIKNIGQGQILFTPLIFLTGSNIHDTISIILPFINDNYEDLENPTFSKKLIEWSING